MYKPPEPERFLAVEKKAVSIGVQSSAYHPIPVDRLVELWIRIASVQPLRYHCLPAMFQEHAVQRRALAICVAITLPVILCQRDI